MYQEFLKIDRLQGYIKDNFNKVIGVLAPWFKGQEAAMPATLLWPSHKPERTLWEFLLSTNGNYSMGDWLSPDTLRAFMRLWEKNRLPGDQQMWNTAQRWLWGPGKDHDHGHKRANRGILKMSEFTTGGNPRRQNGCLPRSSRSAPVTMMLSSVYFRLGDPADC